MSLSFCLAVFRVYCRLATGLRTGVVWGLNPYGAKRMFFLQNFRTCSGNHPTSYSVGIGSSFPGLKRPGLEVYHSPQSSAEVKNDWIYTSTICLPGMDGKTFTFTFLLLDWCFSRVWCNRRGACVAQPVHVIDSEHN